jgi:hypothetical protein
MADNKKTSAEDPAGTLTGAEIVGIVQGGVNKRTTIADMVALASGGGGSGAVFTSGVYGDRPSAAMVGAGSIYIGTDTNEMYLSTGSAFTVLPGGGTETGYCEITSVQSTTSSTTVAISGMVMTFVAGERPFMLVVDGLLHGSSNSVWAGFSVEIGTSIGTVAQRMTGDITGWTPPSAASGIYSALVHFEHRFSQADGFTPGVTYTVVLKAASLGSGGTVSLGASTTQPFFMQTRTL